MKHEMIAKKVDNKGRILIPDLAGSMVLIEQISSGEYLIKAAEIIPVQEAWLYKNKKARAMLEKGLQEAKEGKLVRVSEEDLSWIHQLKDE
jgi:bifunctional DNA-binding transcriptional regulator/antitoxin component of YhaV-PrlF toxin-antitoxin module